MFASGIFRAFGCWNYIIRGLIHFPSCPLGSRSPAYMYFFRTKFMSAMTLVGSPVASLSMIHSANPRAVSHVCLRVARQAEDRTRS